MRALRACSMRLRDVAAALVLAAVLAAGAVPAVGAAADPAVEPAATTQDTNATPQPRHDKAHSATFSRCMNEKHIVTLLNRTGESEHRPLLATTELLGANTKTTVVLVGPLTVENIADLYLKAFYTDPDKHTHAAPVSGEARLLATSLSSDDGQKAIAAKLHIDPTGNYLLQVEVPAAASTGFFPQDRRLTIVACRADGSTPVFWADTSITLASYSGPIVGGIVTVVALYLFCVIVVYLSRRRLIAQSQDARRPAGEKPGKKPARRSWTFYLRWFFLRLLGRLDRLLTEADADTPDAARNNIPPMYRTAEVKPWPWYKYFDPVAISSDLFDRGSLSNLQIFFFSLLVCYGLAYIVLSTGEISGISFTVVELLGVTGLGSVSSKAIGASRNRLSAPNWSWLVSRKVLPINDPGKHAPRWADLVMADSELNLYKLQALAFSVIVGLGLIMGGFQLATFSVPQELLEILLSSQLIFVAGGLAAPASIGDLDKLLDELRAREDALRTAAATGKDVDNSGAPTDKPADGKPVASFEEAKKVLPNAVSRYLQQADQAKIMLQSIAHRDVHAELLENPPLVGVPD